MAREFESALSTHDAESITVRQRDLATEVMDDLSFTAALYYLWTGEVPTDGERRLLDAVLTSLMVHGKTPSAIAARMTALSEPTAVQAAIASGVLGVGSQFIGTMQDCSADLQALAAAADRDAAVESLVTDYLDRGERFAGIGHPHLDPVDPRAETLFDVASEEGIAGEHVDLLFAVRDAFEAETGRDLPINVTGAIAAVTADMGLSPTAARALAVVSRAAGVAGEVLEEQDRPIATDVWQYVDRNTVPPDEADEGSD
ncbi:MAG: citryl-CoA lyase [Haloarculaceae archaeon]